MKTRARTATPATPTRSRPRGVTRGRAESVAVMARVPSVRSTKNGGAGQPAVALRHGDAQGALSGTPPRERSPGPGDVVSGLSDGGSRAHLPRARGPAD